MKDENILSRIAAVSFTLDGNGTDPFATGANLDPDAARQRLLDRDGVSEAFVLRTCQRFELYAEGEDARAAVRGVAAEAVDSTVPDEAVLDGRDAVDHLFRVASGLESGVLGEDEIIGQVRNAYRDASDGDAIEATLDTTVLKAIRVGERARTETEINEGTVSLGSVTVDLVADTAGGIADAETLVIGAGEVAELVVKALCHRDVRNVTVANRTPAPAEELADAVDGEAISLSDAFERVDEVDVLVSATGAPEPVFDRGDLAGTELVVVDLANPRDVAADAASLDGVECFPLEEVLSMRTDGIRKRREAIPAAEAILDEERQRLVEQLRAERVDETLSTLYSDAHDLREAELQRVHRRLSGIDEELTADQEAVIRDFSEALINKLLYPKTTALKQAAARGDRETVEAWLGLFDEQIDGHDVGDATEEREPRTR